MMQAGDVVIIAIVVAFWDRGGRRKCHRRDLDPVQLHACI